MLTKGQERFVQELIKGKSQREAYRIAYPKSVNWQAKNVDAAACRMFKKDKVHARYEELVGAANAKTGDDAASMRAFIIDTYKKIASGEMCETTIEYDKEGNVVRTKKAVKPSDVNNAIAKLAEYYGVAPEINTTQEIKVTLEGVEDYAE